MSTAFLRGNKGGLTPKHKGGRLRGGEGLIQLSLGSTQTGSGGADESVLMICLGVHFRGNGRGKKREAWLLKSWDHVEAAGVKAGGQSQCPPSPTLQAGSSTFLLRGIYMLVAAAFIFINP